MQTFSISDILSGSHPEELRAGRNYHRRAYRQRGCRSCIRRLMVRQPPASERRKLVGRRHAPMAAVTICWPRTGHSPFGQNLPFALYMKPSTPCSHHHISRKTPSKIGFPLIYHRDGTPSPHTPGPASMSMPPGAFTPQKPVASLSRRCDLAVTQLSRRWRVGVA